MSVESPTEPLTEDLLERLLEAETPDAYLDQGETINRDLKDYLEGLIAVVGENRCHLAKVAGVHPQSVYDAFSGKSKLGRDNALLLSFALGCNLRQTQRLLRLSGVAELWPKVRRDAIVIWCIERGRTREECDDELYRLGERTLFKAGAELP